MSKHFTPAAQPLYQDLIIAGFGGQGILLMGNLLAFSAMEAGLHSTFIPVYGAEMRGGTANCTVVIANEEIGSPLIRSPHSLIIMNKPSCDKFLPALLPGGVCVINKNLVDTVENAPANTSLIFIEAITLAEKAGNARLANMVALGAYVAATRILPIEQVEKTLPQVISAHYQHLLENNKKALRLGFTAVAGE